MTPLASSAPLAVLEYRAGEVFTMDPQGRLLLSDADEGQLIVYSREGREESRLGRKGAGPGEYGLPQGAVVGPDGSLGVIDGLLSRFSHYDANHRLVATHPLPGTPLQLLNWDGKHALLVWLEGMNTGPVVGRVDVATGKAHVLYRPYERAPELAKDAPESAAPGSQPWVTTAFARDGRVLVARGETYRIFAFDTAGAVRQRFGRDDVQRERPSEHEAAELEQAMSRMFEKAGLASEQSAPFISAVRTRPKPFFMMHSFATDASGRLWIATQRGAYGETQLDLFGADGTFLRTVAVRDRVRRITISEPYLAVLVKRQSGDAEGAEGVDVYRLDDLR
jgi:hypothetical protein